jgi:hypothetical protein
VGPHPSKHSQTSWFFVVVLCAGRAYTAGGSNAFNSTLLVWDTDNYTLLRVISKRTTPWVRSVLEGSMDQNAYFPNFV